MFIWRGRQSLKFTATALQQRLSGSWGKRVKYLLKVKCIYLIIQWMKMSSCTELFVWRDSRQPPGCPPFISVHSPHVYGRLFYLRQPLFIFFWKVWGQGGPMQWREGVTNTQKYNTFPITAQKYNLDCLVIDMTLEINEPMKVTSYLPRLQGHQPL